MARRMYDLDNGTEDIKVKSIESQLGPLLLKDGYENSFQMSADGFILASGNEILLTIDTGGAYFDKPVYFPQYTTALRPTENLYEGGVIYDSTLKKCILYNGTAWVNLDGTALS